ncbi:MAG: hypothetical protein R3B13_18570 [Polyangiaceae bacterium]
MLAQGVTRLSLVLLALGGVGCAQDCKTTSSASVVYNGGHVDSTASVYETNAWDEPWLHFPPGRRFVFEHGLGVEPYVVNTYLSFSENPLTSSNNASESAGNQAVIEAVTDEFVRIRNDSCADFYLRVTAARAPGDLPDAGTD